MVKDYDSPPMQQQYTGDSGQVKLATPSTEMTVLDKIADLYQQINNLHRQNESLNTNMNRILQVLGIEWV